MHEVDRRTTIWCRAFRSPAAPVTLIPKTIANSTACPLPGEGCAWAAYICEVKGSPMPTGTVKWFNAKKGFGFIQPDNGGSDAFVYINAVERAGISSLSGRRKIVVGLVSDRRL